MINKKIIMLFAFILVLCTAAIGGVYALEQKSEVSQAVKKQIDNQVNQFLAKVDEDVQQSFNLNLAGYEKIDRKALFQDKKAYEKSLRSVYMEVIMNQSDGDILPQLYVNAQQNTGYILEKKADGQNVLYTIQKEDGEWRMVDTQEATGNVIEFEEIK